MTEDTRSARLRKRHRISRAMAEWHAATDHLAAAWTAERDGKTTEAWLRWAAGLVGLERAAVYWRDAADCVAGLADEYHCRNVARECDRQIAVAIDRRPGACRSSITRSELEKARQQAEWAYQQGGPLYGHESSL